ncbi:hypothetical protein ZWY2020_049226 [Hordeum vulgare]|nr:hypothetical protein ZWY2020_049226 [Hordeum vulgare]
MRMRWRLIRFRWTGNWGDGASKKERIGRGGTGGNQQNKTTTATLVRSLQRQLQEEIDMHLALTDAIAHDAELILKSCTKLPNKAQELVDSISSLEITVSKLEIGLSDLRYQLCHVRTERLLVESNPECLLSTPSTSKCTWDEHTSALRDFKLGAYESVQSMEEYPYPFFEKEAKPREKVSPSGQLEEHQDVSLNLFLEEHQDEETLRQVDLSLMASVLRSPSVDSDDDDDIIDEVGNFDPYNVNGKEAQRDIGKYCSVTEVSWMNVCKEQLEYASDALPKFR